MGAARSAERTSRGRADESARTHGAVVEGRFDDAGTDYVYASYDFNDPQGSTWQKITLSHDDNGDLTDDGLLKYTYDAWNRLVGAWYNACGVDGNGRPNVAGERVATYEYDGLFRRVEKTVGNQGSGPVYQSNVNMTGIEAGNRHEHFYSSGWRLVEMQDNATPSNRTLNQFVYGTQYIDEPVVYDRNTDVSADDDCLEAAGSQRYTYHQDANYRVVLLTGEDGAVVERYQYTAYGEPTLYLGGSTEAGNALPVSTVGGPFLHQGLFRDRETLSYQNRVRQLDARDGRFMQTDPWLGGQGDNDYLAVGSSPLVFMDPDGLQFGCIPHFGCLHPRRTPPKPKGPDWGGVGRGSTISPRRRGESEKAYRGRVYRGTKSRGNCYRYACGDPMSDDEIKKGTDEEYYNRHQRSPGGNRPECQPPARGWTTPADCNTLKQCAHKDGLKWTDKNGNCPKGTVTVYLYINPSTGDYHWYRQREDGKYVHKPGGTKERGDDNSGNPIDDPDTANRGGYTLLCGKMCVPCGHVDLDK